MTRGLSALAVVVLYLACLLLAPAGALPDLPQWDPVRPPSLAHPFGTDDLGRDLLAAALQGGRTSLAVAGSATVLALCIGVAVGLVAALAGGVVDEVLMRGAEIVASLPTLLIGVLAAALFGGSVTGLALVIGLTRWPLISRLVRIETMALLRRTHVRAAVAIGATPLRVARRHVLPHLAPLVGAAAGIVFGGAIVIEAALAFVGLGDPATTSWGRMIANGFALFGLGWWLWAGPAAMMASAAGLVALASLGPTGESGGMAVA